MRTLNDLLFVGAGNVCRSPLMELTYRNAAGASLDWPVLSRGVRVPGSSPICPIVATMLPAALADSHQSTQVTAGLVRRAALTITTTTSERATLAQLSPTARARTFTLKQALVLSGSPLSSIEVARARHRIQEGCTPLRAYADVLHGRRGTVATPVGSRVGWNFVSHADAENVPDIHRASSRRHREDLKSLRRHVREFHRRIDAALTAFG